MSALTSRVASAAVALTVALSACSLGHPGHGEKPMRTRQKRSAPALTWGFFGGPDRTEREPSQPWRLNDTIPSGSSVN